MITLLCYLSVLTAILVQLVCLCVCVWHRGGSPLYMSSILMSSQHTPIKLHDLLSSPLLAFSQSFLLPSFSQLLSLQVNNLIFHRCHSSSAPDDLRAVPCLLDCYQMHRSTYIFLFKTHSCLNTLNYTQITVWTHIPMSVFKPAGPVNQHWHTSLTTLRQIDSRMT